VEHTNDLTNPRAVRELLEKYSLSPKKGYGQNFLINRDVPARIAGASAAGGDVGYGDAPRCDGVAVVEIGPGVGAMTAELSELFEKVIAVEIDRGLIPLLSETVGGCSNVTIVNADFLKTDLAALLENEAKGMAVRVCANLPYYVTTPVLMKILEDFPPVGAPRIETVTVMIQSEVADRLCATERDAEYGAVTASVALHGTAKKLFTNAPGNFYPAPKVTSCVVQIALHKRGIYDVYEGAPQGADDCRVFVGRVKRLIEAAFLKRRKTLTNALSGDFPKDKVSSALDALGLRSDIRGERLSARDFCALADLLYK
jgi:16S rRNA (adenine1518-N6/adenine1519-N6)-dimethyltransferase